MGVGARHGSWAMPAMLELLDRNPGGDFHITRVLVTLARVPLQRVSPFRYRR